MRLPPSGTRGQTAEVLGKGYREGIMAEGILTRGGRAGNYAAADGGWRRLLPDILLICINGVGIAGALLEALGVKWDGEINQPLLWGGLLVICVLSVLWWQGKKKGIIWRTAALFLAYGVGAAWLWEAVIVRLWRSLTSGAEDYGELSFEYVGELIQLYIENSGSGANIRALGFLAALFPFALLTGFLCSRGKWQIFLIWNIVWIAAACDSNLFPGMFFLIICVAGIALETARGEFRDNAGVWTQAAALILVVALLGIWAAGTLLLPALNEQYERSIGLRHSFYVTMNHRIIPELQEWVKGYGIGRGVDVTGSLGRQRFLNRTNAGIYQVTMDEKPGQTLYLRGFVGVNYNRRQWEPEDEKAMERYDRENDLTLAQDAAGLLNIGYRAMENRGKQAQIRIEELAGRGSYSLLPYGALVTDRFTAHTVGTVDRRGSSYDFQYRQLSGAEGGRVKERWEILEQQYRRYVYDNFLDYPKERVPRLTEALEAEDLPKGDPYRCAEAVIRFLEQHAGYRLDAPAAPLGKDFVEYFLFDSHEGYCAHFASAAVLMFRYCGIPARYATGYSASSQRFAETEEGLYTAVMTGAQAHAWAEIYLDGVGWVPVEATPGAAAFAEDNRMELLARLGELTGDLEPQEANGSAEEGDEEEEEEEETVLSGLIHELEDLEDEEEEEEEAAAGEAWSLGPAEIALCLLVIVILAAAAAVCTIFFRRRYWKRKLKETEGREKVFLLYHNMRSALWVLGCSGKLLLTGEAFWNRLQTVLPTQEKKDYDRICAILEQSSFGGRELSQEEVAAMRGLHDEMLRKIYFKAPSYKRAAFWGLICCMPPGFGYGQGK